MEFLHFLLLIAISAICFYFGQKFGQSQSEQSYRQLDNNELQEETGIELDQQNSEQLTKNIAKQNTKKDILKMQKELEQLQQKEKAYQLEIKQLKEKQKDEKSPVQQQKQQQLQQQSSDLISDQDFDSLLDETAKNVPHHEVFDQDDLERELNEASK